MPCTPPFLGPFTLPCSRRVVRGPCVRADASPGPEGQGRRAEAACRSGGRVFADGRCGGLDFGGVGDDFQHRCCVRPALPRGDEARAG